MVTRFLRYSLAHERPVRALFAADLRYRNITVVALDGERVTYRVAGRKTPRTCPLSDLLTVGYARGDDGDTLQSVRTEETDGRPMEDEP